MSTELRRVPAPLDDAVYELRQPFTALRGHAQLARDLLATDPVRAAEALEHVLTQVNRIDRQLAELVDRTKAPGRDI